MIYMRAIAALTFTFVLTFTCYLKTHRIILHLNLSIRKFILPCVILYRDWVSKLAHTDTQLESPDHQSKGRQRHI